MKSNKWKVTLSILLFLVFVVSYIGLKGTWLSSEMIAIHIVIHNRTNQRIGPLLISDQRDPTPIQIDHIEPYSIANVYLRKAESWGENQILMTDNNGLKYHVVSYFENSVKGRVDIRIECATSYGLSGKKRNITSSYFSIKWDSWGISNCE